MKFIGGPRATFEDISLEGAGMTISQPIFGQGNPLPSTRLGDGLLISEFFAILVGFFEILGDCILIDNCFYAESTSTSSGFMKMLFSLDGRLGFEPRISFQF